MPRGTLLADCVVLAGLGDFDDFGSEAQSFVAGNIVRLLAPAGVEDFATVLFGAGSGVPVAAALEQQLGGFVAGLTRRRPMIASCVASRSARSMRASTPRCDAPLPQRRAAVGRRSLRIVVDEGDASQAGARGADTGADAAAGRQRADPVYLVVTLLEQGRADYECRSSLLTAGAKAAVLGGTRARWPARSCARNCRKAESGQLGPRDMARFGDGLARLLLPDSVLEGLVAMRRRPLVVVHDGEGSRIPWETLRVGDVHPALEGGLTRRYASETLTVARWQRAARAGHAAAGADGGRSDARPARRRRRRRGTGPHAARRRRRGRAAGGRRRDPRCDAAGDSARAATTCCTSPGTDSSTPAIRAAADWSAPSGEVLRGADLDGLGDLPALVFFNACEAARVRRPRRARRPPPVRVPALDQRRRGDS